jgi:hypothetical protein
MTKALAEAIGADRLAAERRRKIEIERGKVARKDQPQNGMRDIDYLHCQNR